MSQSEPLSDEHYQWLMTWAKRTSLGIAQDKAKAEALWNRHQETVSGDPRRRTAFHEAGHAVAAHALGHRVPYVLIGNDDSGETLWETSHIVNPTLRHEIKRVIDFASSSTAGHVSEELEWGRARYPDRETAKGVATQLFNLGPRLDRDLASVTDLLPHPGDDTLGGMALAIVDLGEQRAMIILRANWNTVCSLAVALLDQWRMDGGLLADLLSKVTVPHGV
jgi:hypothetical protein